MKILNFIKLMFLHEKAARFNKFIEEVCYRDIDTLNKFQRKAVLAFWYDAEMGSGGHGGYFDCYPNTNEEELYNILKEIGNEDIANNYKRAIQERKENKLSLEVDLIYYKFNPSFEKYLEKYVLKNIRKILK